MRTVNFAIVAIAFAMQGAAQPKIPLRTLSAPLAVSRDTFGLVVTARQVANGRVLVNDGLRKRLVLLDSSLRVFRVVFDTVPGLDNSYGPRPEPTMPYRGDTTIFVDHASKTLILIDPNGNVGRSIAAPLDQGLFTVAATAGGLDDRGRILYRGLAMRQREKPGEAGLMVALNGTAPPTSNADSNPIIRGDFQTRGVDTVAALASLNAQHTTIAKDANGVATWITSLNPRPVGDEWAVTSDGTIAIVRGQDYHIDWITSDGKKTSTGKLPFDWKRISDAEKVRLRDSTANTMSRADSIEEIIKARNASSGGAATVGRTGGAGSDASPAFTRPIFKTTSIPINEISDYEPSIRQGSVLADRDNHVWILPATSAQSVAGELVYDVVNRQGELFQRVRLPLGRSIIGFGRGGAVFLMRGSLKTGFQLERAMIAPAPGK